MRNPIGSRVLRHAAVLATAASLLTASYASADTLRGDGDPASGFQGSFHVGTVEPGGTIEADVSFWLACSSFFHLNADQSVVLTPGASTVVGGSVDFTGATFSPPGDGWPDDGDDCAASPDPIESTSKAHVTITAPATEADDLPFLLTWTRSIEPAAPMDSNTFNGSTTGVTLTVDVVANTPPVLSLPANFQAEANPRNGWTAAWTVSATDAQDEADPTPVCTPAAGSVLRLGPTTVSCTVTDSGGLTTSGTFRVSVIDTTAPTLHDVPSGLALTTTDPAGAPLVYTPPTASDVVDANPIVNCVPGPGLVAPVGTSQVTCTAHDANGNVATASIPVNVALEGTQAWTVTWDEPVSAGSPALTANSGRSVPVKVRVSSNGADVTTGVVTLATTPCGGGPAGSSATLVWSTGAARWTGKLETAGLGAGCHAVVLFIDGVEAGSFTLTVTGGPAPVKGSGGGGGGDAPAKAKATAAAGGSSAVGGGLLARAARVASAP